METKDPLSVLVVDDEEISLRSLARMLASLSHQVTVAQSGEAALELLREKSFDLVITDLVMPGMDGFALVQRGREVRPEAIIIILTGHDSFDLARRAQELGADNYLTKPLNLDQLEIAVHQAREKMELRTRIEGLGRLVENRFGLGNIIGVSPPIREALRRVELARNSTANVLITGESGTGKELVARAIYNPRLLRGRSFVTVNCCAISEGLIESELFGHVRGAFTGAISDRQGLFEAAHGGIIFLDEIGDIPPSLQTKLLRVLQNGELRRVGDNETRTVSVRVVAATNRNLEEAVKSGSFREDLYWRLNVIPIPVPPLRDRKDDIPLLTEHFLRKHSTSPAPRRFTGQAMRRLQEWAWPGNVRELENMVLRTLSFSLNDPIPVEDLDGMIDPGSPSAGATLPPPPTGLTWNAFQEKAERTEREFLIATLQAADGSVSRAAAALGMGRTALHNKIARHGIDRKPPQ